MLSNQSGTGSEDQIEELLAGTYLDILIVVILRM